MGLWKFIFGRKPEPEPEVEIDPLDEIIHRIDALNELVSSFPRGISLWINYEPGAQKGHVILRRRDFGEAVQIYPQPAVEAFQEAVIGRRRGRPASRAGAAR